MKWWRVGLIGIVVVLLGLAGLFWYIQRPIFVSSIDENNLPKFIQADFIDLSRVASISKFRSSAGHDFSGGGETCRSMKHYFTPPYDPNGPQYGKEQTSFPDPDPATAIPIFSPVDGTVQGISEEHTPIGKQVSIRATSHPEYNIRLFHVYTDGIKMGSHVTAGQKIGIIGANQGTDIAIELFTLKGETFVSYFSVMPDNVFAGYEARGAKDRSDFILTKEYRDAHPLECGGAEKDGFAKEYQADPNYDEEVYLSGYSKPIQTEYEGKLQDQGQPKDLSYYEGGEAEGGTQGASVSWQFNGSQWQSMGDTPPSCAEPLTVTTPTDITKATAILYPGQTRGGDYKAHGGFIFGGAANDSVTVKIPLDASLTRGSRYIEQGETQYFFIFTNPCGIMYRFDHLLTLSSDFQKIADTLPVAKVDDSSTTIINPPVQFKTGDVVATAVGFPKIKNTSFDFGVYDLRQKNAASADSSTKASQANQQEFGAYGVCWLNLLTGTDKDKALSLPGGDGQAGKTSEYCK